MNKRTTPPAELNRNKGFTLAETLITLVIIGVVAAITIPVMITSYNKQATVEKLKKAYSALSQTTARAIADNGPIQTWEVNRNDSTSFVNQYLLPYLSVGKKCNNSSDYECNYDATYMNGSKLVINPLGNSFYLLDGTFIDIQNIQDLEQGYGRVYADIYIDINGSKKPNKMGKDIFQFRYEIYNQDVPKMTGKFAPPDMLQTRNQALNMPKYGCNKQALGEYCSNVIMLDSWQISKDYPW